MKFTVHRVSRFGLDRRSGLTLVEVLLAMAILAVLSVVVVTALMYPGFIVVSSTRRQIALNEGQRDMERVSAMPYVSIANTNYSVNALNGTLAVTRMVTTNAVGKNITVEVRSATGDLLVDLVTERTP